MRVTPGEPEVTEAPARPEELPEVTEAPLVETASSDLDELPSSALLAEQVGRVAEAASQSTTDIARQAGSQFEKPKADKDQPEALEEGRVADLLKGNQSE